MKTKYILLSAAAMLCLANARSQDPLSREVDVTRAYEPSVQNALKLNILPDMTDTVQVRPDHAYEITPRPLDYGFGVAPLTPARFAAADGTAALPFYAKLGAGGPLRSVADLRYSRASERMDYGVFATHTGRYGKQSNDMGIEESVFGTANHAGAFLDYRLRDDLTVGGEAGFRHRNVTRYGYYYPTAEKPFWLDTSDKFMTQYHLNPYARVALGTDFRSARRFHFRVGAGGDYFTHRYKYDQTNWALDGTVGFRAGSAGMVTVAANLSLSHGQKNFDGNDQTITRLSAGYAFTNNGVDFRLGLGVGSLKTTFGGDRPDEDNFVLLPRVAVEKALDNKGRANLFAELNSTVTGNSYGELARRNPYVYSGQRAIPTLEYRTRAGLRGTVAAIRYAAYAGFTMQRDAALWANAYSGWDTEANGASKPFEGNGGNVFTVVTEDLDFFEFGLDFSANVTNSFVWQGALNLRSLSPDSQPEAWGMPETQFNTTLTYNLRERLYLRAGVEFTGERPMLSLSEDVAPNTLPGQTDLSIGADYFFNKQFGVFVRLTNLLDQDLYTFNRYREPGRGVTAGVKLSF